MTTGRPPSGKMASAAPVVSCLLGLQEHSSCVASSNISRQHVLVTKRVRPASDGIVCWVRVTSW